MKKPVIFAFSFCLVANLVACNLPATPASLPWIGKETTPAHSTPTKMAGEDIPTAGLTRVPTEVLFSASATPTRLIPTLAVTLIPTLTASANPDCDQAGPGNPVDISVPDNSNFDPGQSFTKTWRLLNTGTCTWSSDYAAVWFSGDTFGAPRTTNLTNPVAPGKSVDISVDMVAPTIPGTYQSNWKMQNPAGKLFGIGPAGDAPFWVRITVSQPSSLSVETPVAETPAARVYANGFANLTINDGLNLDQIKINQGTADDLLYTQKDGSQHLLVPENGAQIIQIGKGQPSITDCQSTSLSADPQVLDGLSPGAYFCYKTNMGLPGWARLAYLNPNDQVLTIEILTWSAP
jgi:hypothetical protein